MTEDDPARVASDPLRSAWVAANAGAGKTFTLANRVARLLLAEARPERILCLTFTKAAAAEMQGRLFAQLGAWSMLPDGELAARIEDLGTASGGTEQLRRARRLFAQALETPGGLEILTIHAFCQTVLARFPIEAGVPPGFEVLDEASSRALIAAARQRVLERAGAGDARLASAIAHLVSETSEVQLQSLLDAALGTDRRKLDRYFDGLDSGGIARAVARAHGVAEGESAEGVARAFCESLHADAGTVRQLGQWLAAGTQADIGRGAALKSAAMGESGAFARLRDSFITTKGEPYKTLASAKLAKARPDLAALLGTIAERFLAVEERRRALRCASLAEAALTLIAAVRSEYMHAKRAAGRLDYDDLIMSTLGLLEKRDGAAWVLYKLDGGIDHVLVDEAQDTSPEQWTILRKLTDEFFAASDERTRTIFAVGDEKQSIFSFQGADPKQFDRNRRHFRARAAAAGHHFIDQPLRTSRRSTPDILAFIDEVFANPAAREGLTSGEEPVRHDAYRKDAQGRIEFRPSLKPAEAVEVDFWHPVDVESDSSPVARLAKIVADEIKGWLDRGQRLPGHERPIEPGDIMILLPRREPFGSEIIRRLKLANVPVAGADRIALSQQIAAMDLVALGRFAILPEDDLNLAALLRSPLGGLSEEDLFALSHGRAGTLWHALSNRCGEVFARAHEFLSDMLSRADYAPPFEFYAHALTARGRRADMLARLGADAADVIDEFLSLALDFESAATPSLEAFLDWIRRADVEIRRDMERGRNQVRVMTVHGAKGLETDIVILPDTTSLPEPASKKGHLLYAGGEILYPATDEDAPAAVKVAKAAALKETLEEHRRLLYVALTRAKDRLYICGFEGRRGVREGSWYALVEQVARTGGVEVTRGDARVLVRGETSDEASEARGKPSAAQETLPGWIVNPAPPERMKPPVRPSDLGEPAVFSPIGQAGALRFRRGLLVHAMLAQLPEMEPAAQPGAARRFLRARGLDTHEADALLAETLGVIRDPLFAPVFGPEARAEIAIVTDLPELGSRIHGRLDRLAVTEDGVLIVDFKTNRPPPAREEDVSADYLTQMAIYRAQLRHIFPGQRITCALLWTGGPRLMRLSDQILDSQWNKIVARSHPDSLDLGEARS